MNIKLNKKMNIMLNKKTILLTSLLTFGLVQNAIASSTIVTDAVGTPELWTFEEVLGAQKMTSRINQVDGKGVVQTWDANGNMLSRTDSEGRVMTYTYNATNQRTSMTEASGTPEQRTTTYEYINADIDLVTKTTSPSIFNNRLKDVINTYDTNENITAVTINGFDASGSPVTRVMSFDHDVFGKVTSIDGARTDINDVTTLAYYDCDTGAECGQLQSVTNALGHTSTYDRYDAAARLLQSTNPNDVVTTYLYHPRGWLLSMTQTPPEGDARVTSYEYDNVGQLIKTTLPDGTEQNYVYDASHALREISDNVGNKVTYEYDAKGNRTDQLTFDPDGSLVRSVITAYDIRNFIESINNGGSVTQMVNDAVGNLSTSIDPNENPENEYTFDALDRLNNTVDSLANNSANKYDVVDNLIEATAPNGASTQYEYDDLGNMTQEISADRGTITYRHDDAGNVISMTDARNITTNYVYDALNRVTDVTYPTANENINYRYDVGTYAIGNMHQATDDSGTMLYEYDPWGNVVRLENQLRDDNNALLGNFVTQYAYDAEDRIISTTYPSGRVVTISRDEIGRLVGLQTTNSAGESTNVITDRTYRADGLWTSQGYGNGLTQTKEYDVQGRLVEQDSGSYQRDYQYDQNSNILDIDARDDSHDVDYEYDVLDRLTYTRNFLQSQEQDFAYDANGNREQFTENGQTSNLNYQTDSNRLTNIDGTRLSLDPSGRTLEDEQGRQYTYNDAGRLSVLRMNNAVVGQYTYNSYQLRTHKTANGVNTLYHYDLAGNLILETNNQGAVIQEYIYADGERVATIAEEQSTDGATPTTVGAIDLSNDQAYGVNQDRVNTGAIELSNGNTAITLNGNRWRGVPLDYNITENTVLEFDFSSTLRGEIHGIALDDDLGISQDRTFQLYGSQRFGFDDFRNYREGSGVVHYTIPVGEFYQGTVSYLGFVMDNDANRASDSTFANIRVYEALAEVTSTTSGGGPESGLQYYINDHLMTPQQLVDADQNVTWEATYEAFGAVEINTESVVNNHRFPGQYFDVESGLYYNWNRYYDSHVGRYVTSDPIGLDGGLNTFGYVGGNPLGRVDPTGEAWFLAPLLAGGGTAAGGGAAAGAGAAAGSGGLGTFLAGVLGFSAIMSIPSDTPQSDLGETQCTDDSDGDDCILQFQRNSKWPGVPDGWTQCVYNCQTGSGATKIIRFVPEGTICPQRTNWVPGLPAGHPDLPGV